MEPTEAKTEIHTNSIESLAAAIAGRGGISKGPKTKIGLVKWLHSEIVNARNSGFSVSEILETLKNCGFSKNTTLNHFYGLMHKADIEIGSSHNRTVRHGKDEDKDEYKDEAKDKNTGDKNELIHMSSIPGFGGGAPKKPNY